MPRKCCVPNCRSNYRETEYVSVFGFPKDEKRRNFWIRQINRDFTPTKHSVVCIKHFEDRFILREERRIREDGIELCVKRKVPTLSKDGYPSIFNEVPRYSKYNRGRRKKYDMKKNKIDVKPECIYLDNGSSEFSHADMSSVYAELENSQDDMKMDESTLNIRDPLDNQTESILGKRIIDFMYLFEQLQKISLHNPNKKCNFINLHPIAEKTDGLSSEILLKCSNCNMEFTVPLNDKADGSDLNYSAVSGAEVTGLGFLGLKTLCDSIGMVSLTEDKYYTVQKEMEIYEQDSIFLEEKELNDDAMKEVHREINKKNNKNHFQNNTVSLTRDKKFFGTPIKNTIYSNNAVEIQKIMFPSNLKRHRRKRKFSEVKNEDVVQIEKVCRPKEVMNVELYGTNCYFHSNEIEITPITYPVNVKKEIDNSGIFALKEYPYT